DQRRAACVSGASVEREDVVESVQPDRVRAAVLLWHAAGAAGGGGGAALWQEAEGAAGGAEHGGSGAALGGGQAWSGADAAGDGVWLRFAHQRVAGVAGDGHRREPDGGDSASRQGREGSAGAA